MNNNLIPYRYLNQMKKYFLMLDTLCRGNRESHLTVPSADSYKTNCQSTRYLNSHLIPCCYLNQMGKYFLMLHTLVFVCSHSHSLLSRTLSSSTSLSKEVNSAFYKHLTFNNVIYFIPLTRLSLLSPHLAL